MSENKSRIQAKKGLERVERGEEVSTKKKGCWEKSFSIVGTNPSPILPFFSITESFRIAKVNSPVCTSSSYLSLSTYCYVITYMCVCA